MAKERKTADEILYSGAIMKAYGSNYLVSICPAFNIDKVRISLVKLNTAGKESSDIYLSCEEFRQFMFEVDKGIAEKKFAADTGAFPAAYKWIKGENGCKALSIGGGTSGVRVQSAIADDTGKKEYKMSVVSLSDLKQASFFYKLVSGLIEKTPGSYYAFLYDTYWKGVDERSENFLVKCEPGDENWSITEDYVNQGVKTESAEISCGESQCKATEEIGTSVYDVNIFAGEEPADGFTAYKGRISDSAEECKVFFENRFFSDNRTYGKLSEMLKKSNGVKVKVQGKFWENSLYVADFVSGKESK